MKDNNSVRVETAPSIVVSHWLRQNGYVPANVLGEAWRTIGDEDAIGILVETGEKPRKRFFGLIVETPRRPWLGTLWIENAARRAGDGRWVLEVHGPAFTDRAADLAAKVAELCGSQITVRVTREESDRETFFSDIDGD